MSASTFCSSAMTSLSLYLQRHGAEKSSTHCSITDAVLQHFMTHSPAPPFYVELHETQKVVLTLSASLSWAPEVMRDNLARGRQDHPGGTGLALLAAICRQGSRIHGRHNRFPIQLWAADITGDDLRIPSRPSTDASNTTPIGNRERWVSFLKRGICTPCRCLHTHLQVAMMHRLFLQCTEVL